MVIYMFKRSPVHTAGPPGPWQVVAAREMAAVQQEIVAPKGTVPVQVLLARH